MISGNVLVKRLCYLQGGLVLGISLVYLFLGHEHSAISALLGGSVCCVPSWLFAKRYFKYRGAQAAERIVQSFYRGEALKFGLTALLFGGVFYFIPIKAVPFFGAFILAQTAYWLAPLL